MKIFLLLFIIFVPKAHSRLHPSKYFEEANDSFKKLISDTFCSIGRHIASDAAKLNKICSKLHDLGTKLPETVPLKGITDDLGKKLTKENPLKGLNDKATAKSLDYVCNKPAKRLGDLSKIFTKFCQNGSQMTTPELTTLSTAISALTTLSTSIPALTTLSTSTLAPTTQSTSTLAPTTQSSSSLAPTTSTLAPTTQETSTLAPSTSTLAPSTSTITPTTLITSTLAPTTLRTSTPAPTTTQSICDKSTNDRCTDTCKRKSGYQLNLGGKCVVVGGDTRMCRCKKVTHCESYKNATCEKKCEQYKGDICRIPEAGYPCVCKFIAGGETFYRVPK